mmetsp:Transcript_798/g.2766  ORF Transcript_798/g.2766 Transcript_798/m.2766 type:complete len:238 (-) Transcript_798:283-996(-)
MRFCAMPPPSARPADTSNATSGAVPAGTASNTMLTRPDLCTRNRPTRPAGRLSSRLRGGCAGSAAPSFGAAGIRGSCIHAISAFSNVRALPFSSTKKASLAVRTRAASRSDSRRKLTPASTATGATSGAAGASATSSSSSASDLTSGLVRVGLVPSAFAAASAARWRSADVMGGMSPSGGGVVAGKRRSTSRLSDAMLAPAPVAPVTCRACAVASAFCCARRAAWPVALPRTPGAAR